MILTDFKRDLGVLHSIYWSLLEFESESPCTYSWMGALMATYARNCLCSCFVCVYSIYIYILSPLGYPSAACIPTKAETRGQLWQSHITQMLATSKVLEMMETSHCLDNLPLPPSFLQYDGIYSFKPEIRVSPFLFKLLLLVFASSKEESN